MYTRPIYIKEYLTITPTDIRSLSKTLLSASSQRKFQDIWISMKTTTAITIIAALFACCMALPFHSARCLSQKKNCSRRVALRSGLCNPFKAPREQPQGCIDDACSFCTTQPGRMSKSPCNSSFITSRCSVRTNTSPEDSNPSTCVYQGNRKAVIDLGSVTPARGWSHVRREGMNGIIFDRNRRSRTIVRAGLEGVMCFDIKIQEGGQYYTTAITSSPDNTEHNDLWIRSDKGFRLLRDGRFRPTVNSYVKGFQNSGHNRIANTLKTIDHNGHYLITDVVANERFQICISGRSSMFEVFRIVLVKCTGVNCTPRDVSGDLEDLSPTRCM